MRPGRPPEEVVGAPRAQLAGGEPVLANIDAEGGYFRRPLLKVRGLVENYANWYSVYTEFKSYPARASAPSAGER